LGCGSVLFVSFFFYFHNLFLPVLLRSPAFSFSPLPGLSQRSASEDRPSVARPPAISRLPRLQSAPTPAKPADASNKSRLNALVGGLKTLTTGTGTRRWSEAGNSIIVSLEERKFF
jgi:hypothetical protein